MRLRSSHRTLTGFIRKLGVQMFSELHGNASKVITASGVEKPLAETKQDSSGLHIDGEWARPAITLYGEALNPETLAESIKAIKEADVLLVMGTSLNVYPAAGLIYEYEGSKSALINKERTPLNADFIYEYTGSISQWVRKTRKVHLKSNIISKESLSNH